MNTIENLKIFDGTHYYYIEFNPDGTIIEPSEILGIDEIQVNPYDLIRCIKNQHEKIIKKTSSKNFKSFIEVLQSTSQPIEHNKRIHDYMDFIDDLEKTDCDFETLTKWRNKYSDLKNESEKIIKSKQ